MQAIVHHQYGPPEVALLTTLEKPIPKSNEVLIKVVASTVNRTDCGFRSAVYVVSRFWSGLFKPKHKILGCEFAGIVDEIGSEVKHFSIGDKVFGYNDISFGGHAEYLCIAENDAIACIPNNCSFIEAAAITEGAHYAWNIIRASKTKKGQQALVVGSSGAIGSAAVQLLKHMEVVTTAVCNKKNVRQMKLYGVDEVIDYETTDFRLSSTKFDFVFDAVGKTSFQACKPIMTENGIYISTELGKRGANIFYAMYTKWFSKKKVLFPIPIMNKQIINYLKELVENNKFRPLIDRTYPLQEIVNAYHYVESGQKSGNVILVVDNLLAEEKEIISSH